MAVNREAFSLARNKRLRQLMDEAYRGAKETGRIPFARFCAKSKSSRRVRLESGVIRERADKDGRDQS